MRKKQLNSRTLLTVLILGIFVLLTAIFGPENVPQTLGSLSENQPGHYSVVSVSDGDTIVVDMNGTDERIRLIGVDTPEKNHPEKPVQCFAEAASQFTEQLLDSQSVRLEADPTNDNRDRYNRLLRYVYLPDNTLVNAEIIKQGYGFAYLSFPFSKMDEFQRHEQHAADNSLGLWSDCQIDFDNGQPQTNDS